MSASLADQLDALLPQTQCTRCGYPACRPYAEAMARSEAAINRCPPGGATGIERLAKALNLPLLELDAACGIEKAVETVARVIEADCIGCTKCIQACPVDAIIGAMNLMHAVLTEECNGCELCVPPCPVDCIVMEPVPNKPPAFEQADQFRARFYARGARHVRSAQEEASRRQERKTMLDPVAAALARSNLSPVREKGELP